jgi:hypothetical protein
MMMPSLEVSRFSGGKNNGTMTKNTEIGIRLPLPMLTVSQSVDVHNSFAF